MTGGDDGSRTRGLLRARQTLSQLSYIPKGLERVTGLEPVTTDLASQRSTTELYPRGRIGPVEVSCRTRSTWSNPGAGLEWRYPRWINLSHHHASFPASQP